MSAARLLQLAAVIEEQASVLYRYPGDPLPDTVADVLTDIARELRAIASRGTRDLPPERERLIEALKPFAAMAEVYNGLVSSEQPALATNAKCLYVGQFRRARELVETLDGR